MSTIMVTKRDGSVEDFKVEKVRKCINWACEGLQVNPLALESRFNEYLQTEVTTKVIQDSLVFCARSLATAADSDFVFVAGRLMTMNIWKETGIYEKPFYDVLTDGVVPYAIDNTILSKYTKAEIEELGSYMVQERDLNHSFGSVLTAINKYLLPNEAIQPMIMASSMIIASVEDQEIRVAKAKEFYDSLSNRELSLATPWWGNLRSDGNISSCFIIKPSDSLESIFANVTRAAMTSKAGGGLGVSMAAIRAQGSPVGGRPNSSKGVFNWTKIFNDVAIAVDQCFHPDTLVTTQNGFKAIKDIIPREDRVLTDNGKFNRVEEKIMYEQSEPMYRVRTAHDLVDTFVTGEHPVKALTNLDTLEHGYLDVKDLEIGDYLGQKIPSYTIESELTHEELYAYGTSLMLPGANHIDSRFLHIEPEKQMSIIFGMIDAKGSADNANELIIESANLAHEIRYLLLRNGIPVKSEYVGGSFKLTIQATGKLALMLGVNDVEEVDWIVSDGYIFSPITEFEDGIEYNSEVYDLRVQSIPSYQTHAFMAHNGGKRAGAITVELPIWHRDIEGFLEIQHETGDLRTKCFDIFPQVGMHDLFMKMDAADGENDWHTFCPYEVKQVLDIQLDEVYGKEFEKAYKKCVKAYEKGDLKNVAVYKTRNLIKSMMRTQFESGLPYVAYLDTINDDNPNDHEGTIPSVNLCVAPETLVLTDKGNLPIVTLKDQWVNVWNGHEFSEVLVEKTADHAHLLHVETEGGRSLDATDYHKWYRVVDGEMEMVRTFELKPGDEVCVVDNYPIDRIKSIDDQYRWSDVYCFNEPKRHLGVFNGIITGQCNESFSVVKPDVYGHSCNLISIVAGRVKDYEHLEYLAGLATRMLDNGIELTKDPMDIAGAHNERYRTIGIGIQGLHDWLAKNRKMYNDTKFIGEFAETIQFGAVKESIKLAKERGAYPAYSGSRWDTGKQIAKYRKHSRRGLDWNSLQTGLDQYGIRNSQLTSPAPNTTTSIFMDAGPGVMPCYGGFYLKDNTNGEFPVAGMYLKENPLCYAKNAARYDHETLVNAVAEIQKFTDAGISSEYIFDHNKEGFSAKELYDLIHLAWRKKTKAVYYIRNIKKGSNLEEEVGMSQASCEGCAN